MTTLRGVELSTLGRIVEQPETATTHKKTAIIFISYSSDLSIGCINNLFYQHQTNAP
jgi:hypothetical protein